MFTKTKCPGCRKDKYFVKYIKLKAPFGSNEPIRSIDKLCLICGWKLKRITKKMRNAK